MCWQKDKRICYIRAMTQGTKEILRRVEHWPPEDQDQLAEVAREIDARRTGVYVLSDGEWAALDIREKFSTASVSTKSKF